MKKRLLVFATVLTFVFPVFSQNTEGGSEKKEVKKAAPVRTMLQENLPQLSSEWLQRLWDSCTLVDYTYLTMPITMSLDKQGSIRSSLRHIGIGSVVRQADCKLFAKLFYQSKGKIILDADLFFSDSCSVGG